jgi:hypothetical protein
VVSEHGRSIPFADVLLPLIPWPNKCQTCQIHVLKLKFMPKSDILNRYYDLLVNMGRSASRGAY